MHTSTIFIDTVDKKISKSIPKAMAQKYKSVPVFIKDNKLVVAMADPYNFIAIEDIKLHTNLDIEPIHVQEKEINEIIHLCFDLESENIQELDLPVIELIDNVINKAVEKNASDIHIEPTKDNIRIRFRIDGDLFLIKTLPLDYSSSIVSRIKIMGNMNIAERRIAQDGRFEIVIDNNEIDVRLSTMPTIYGEKVVLRLLNKSKFSYEIDNLGFNKRNLDTFLEIISQPFGMVLVTGPTGCGKSTTLYTILREINDMEKNIVTIEDPVEFKIHGINQIQVNYKAGLDFASGLRSLLRQDPDYIFVGEIRDQETSRLAVRAAITGHLLFSTLHTNDSISAIHRLIDMGIEPYLLSSSLIGVISQRLIKLLCPKCKKKYVPNENQKRTIDVEDTREIFLYKPEGCKHCNNGYIGRTAIYEVLKINDEIRELIDRNSNISKIKKTAMDSKMGNLFDSAKELVILGETSYEEGIKVKT